MHPMMATVTPGRCPVASWIFAVVSCRSKRVLPQLGHDTNSVFVLRIRHPCRREKEVVRTKSSGKALPSGSMRTPSPSPSARRAPTCVPSWRASSLLSSMSVAKWCMTGTFESIFLRTSNTRRLAWRGEMSMDGLRRTIVGSMAVICSSISSGSSPLTVTARRIAPPGNFPPDSTAFVTSMRATAFGSGLFSSSSAGTMIPMDTSSSLLIPIREGRSSGAGTFLSSIESVVATSLNGIPTAVLHPRLLYRYWAFSGENISRVTAEMTLPSRCRNPRTSMGSSSFCAGRSATLRPNCRTSRVSTYLGTASCFAAATGLVAITLPSAISESLLHGSYSNSGSSVSETRTVSPSPSASSVPMPMADFIRPSSPSPASVTPRCRG
mmetsp:Transcript_12578/g.25129  ORF Transcript_12578/g.25129 Transcript_12578/m.25129 type:complete len:381 (+) Transcript_12578:303-1445(+)